VAANECAAASAACLNLLSRLNSLVEQYGHTALIDNLTYAIAADNNLAQLYVAWKDESTLTYYLQRVDSFMLCRPDEFSNLRRQVRNILDWAKGTRLTQIRKALDIVLEEKRKKDAELAKSRQGPVEDGVPSKRQR
jgi:hypothetical protein